MYSWKAIVGSKELDSSKDSYGDIDQNNLDKFFVMDKDNEVAEVDLDTGKISIFGAVKKKSGSSKDRDLIWIKRNLAQPGKILKTTYFIGYYENGKKIAFTIDPDNNVKKVE